MDIDEIKKQLEPHRVEGFTAFCIPMPTLEHINWLISEHDRLTTLSHRFESERDEERQRAAELAAALTKAEAEMYEANNRVNWLENIPIVQEFLNMKARAEQAESALASTTKGRDKLTLKLKRFMVSGELVDRLDYEEANLELETVRRERDKLAREVERLKQVERAAWIRTESYEAVQAVADAFRQGAEWMRGMAIQEIKKRDTEGDAESYLCSYVFANSIIAAIAALPSERQEEEEVSKK